jgi:hypothetical protein
VSIIMRIILIIRIDFLEKILIMEICVPTNIETLSVIPATVVISQLMIYSKRSKKSSQKSGEPLCIVISNTWQKKGSFDDFPGSMERPTMSAMRALMHISSMKRQGFFVIFRWKISASLGFQKAMKCLRSVSRSVKNKTISANMIPTNLLEQHTHIGLDLDETLAHSFEPVLIQMQKD